MSANIYQLVDQQSNAKKEDTIAFIFKHGKKRSCIKDEVIITEGGLASTVFIILTGKVQVYRKDLLNNIVIISESGDGDIFGEMGIFLDRKRSASVKALVDTVVMEFTNADFVKAILNIPDLMYRLFKCFAENITSMNDLLNRMSELNVIKTIVSYFLKINIESKDESGKITVSLLTLSKELYLTNEQIYSALQYLKKINALEHFSVLAGSIFTFQIKNEKIFELLMSQKLQ
ncbi:MAG TPA: cyclic nucleotide-binding domain-containing protein [Candidatus Cloacimonadota bacterium]|nr:cyclic nucleotide-binding domain-containing protein [Candidatus Cloacimonadota bacterium]HQB41533.1 cyclic nucleotide-binding domain-containing protein [Candidatus Cloacimonadota bacterium]